MYPDTRGLLYRQTKARRFDRALEALATFERNHGPSPESAYRQGVAHQASGDGERANEAFGRVGELAREHARYQKTRSTDWVSRHVKGRYISKSKASSLGSLGRGHPSIASRC